MPAINPAQPFVSSLHFYPIKSCRGFALQRADVGKRGIINDRLFLIVDTSGRFVTQREKPKLALLQPEICGDKLTLSAPGMEPLAIERRQTGATSAVSIWRDTCEAVDQGDAVAEWLSQYLGETVRLTHIACDYSRIVNQNYALKPTDEVAFADGYPFLLISESSLADLNSRLDQPLEMNRFRPNIVVANTTPFAEDEWRRIRIGAIIFELVKPCARCVITTVDQATAKKGKEPLRTLAAYRTIPERGAMFGQNLVHHNEGSISVGSAVEILL